MTVRLWLMVADCWQCGASIELTEEQEREAQRLLGEAGLRPRELSTASTPTSPAGNASTATHLASPERTAAPSAAAPLPSPAPLAPTPRRETTARTASHRASTAPASRRPAVRARLRRAFDSTPAWLISLVLHAVLLTLLALLTLDGAPADETITISAAVSRADVEGGVELPVDPNKEVAFDLPIPRELNLADSKVREVVTKADQDARELRLDPGVDEPNLPALDQVKSAIGGGRGLGGGRNLAARDPRVRVLMVHQEGGTTMTEAAVSRGLRWLALHQGEDGAWSLHRFHQTSGCSCSGRGAIHSDTAATSLALMPYLGAGQTHLVGLYKNHVSAALRWLIAQQKPTGDLRGTSVDNAGMYAHGQATIVLCEAYLMTGDEELKGPAQRAIDFIVRSQHPAGGWRYSPGQPGDTSVLGWQLMALQSGRAANLHVPVESLELATRFLDSVSHDGGAKYAYVPGHGPTHVMTAEALLCRMYLGWKHDYPPMEAGIQYLLDRHLPSSRDPNIYYWYYATQTLHHFGGPAWDRWNTRMREILVETQERSGHEAGSWDPKGDHGSAGGRIYMTALAICSLEVYYRHLPIFRQLDLREP